jgi:pimeloyl-ACP methyl ester carboxylesterase
VRSARYLPTLTLMLALTSTGSEVQMQTGHGTAASTPREAYAEVNGVRLHYVEEGKGPLILFLHGFPEFWYAWKDLLPEFAKDHRAVAVDMRGYNLSSMPEAVDAYQVPILVEDVRALAEKLGAKKFVLVGHDWGGVVAWAFAAAHPEMLEKLVIINAPHPAVFARELANNPDQQKASAYFNLFTSPVAEATLSQNDFAILQQSVLGTWASDADREKYLEFWRIGLTGGLNYYRAASLRSPVGGEKADARSISIPKNPIITVPTLVIWGLKDTALLQGNLDGLDEYVKALKIERVPEGSHWVVHEQPATVIQSMRQFLK